MAKLWNDLPFPPDVFQSYGSYCSALSNYDWKNCLLTQSLFYRVTDFFGNPEVFENYDCWTDAGNRGWPSGDGS